MVAASLTQRMLFTLTVSRLEICVAHGTNFRWAHCRDMALMLRRLHST